MGKIIRHQLTRDQQNELIRVLTAVCIDLGVDPENEDSFLGCRGVAENEHYGKFLMTMIVFFRLKLHMQQ